MSSSTLRGPTLTGEAIELLAVAERNVSTARVILGQSIHARRVALDLSGAQLARIAGVNASELSKLERGLRGAGALAGLVDDALSRIEAERASVGLRLA